MLKFLKRMMKRYGRPCSIVTDRLRSYGAAMKVNGNVGSLNASDQYPLQAAEVCLTMPCWRFEPLAQAEPLFRGFGPFG